MDGIEVTYVGRSNLRRAIGAQGSYLFRHGTTLTIPAEDVEAVTGPEPADWRVARPTPAASETTPTRPPRARKRATRQPEE